MIASGRISTDAYPAGSLGVSGSLLGMEFSGYDPNGNRVMGYTFGKAIATSVNTSPLFVWPVPQNWSLEEASTIPIVYSTVYYSLYIRAQIRPGESILIHSGAGGVGQVK